MLMYVYNDKLLTLCCNQYLLSWLITTIMYKTTGTSERYIPIHILAEHSNFLNVTTTFVDDQSTSVKKHLQ